MNTETRIGIGFDVHRLVGGRPCIIGGVKIEHPRGLLGHSDADVLLHALADAMLGAMGLGDIGTFFPDSDERFRGMDSMKIIDFVRSALEERSARIVNLDCVVMAEQPKLSPHIPAMKEAIAKTLGTSPSRVGIKATTTEKLGFVGRAEGIAAQAVVSLELPR